jgi:hypothetical protein
MTWGGHLFLFINDVMAGINRVSGKFPGLKIVYTDTNLSSKAAIWKQLGVFT